MSSNEFVPTIAGIVMAVFGFAMAAAMLKGILVARRRRHWPVVPGHVTLKNAPGGKKNAVALIRYRTADGTTRTTELATGGLSSQALKGQTIEVAVNPEDPDVAVPKSAVSNVGTMGCFGVLALFFALFGLATLVMVLTN